MNAPDLHAPRQSGYLWAKDSSRSSLKVEFRISVGITAVVAVALATALTLIQVLLNRFQEHQLDLALIELAQQEARAAPTHNFAFTTHPGPAANDVGPLDKYGVIYGEHGVVIAATEPFDVAPPARSDLKHETVGVPFDLAYRGRSLRAVLVPLPKPEKAMLLLAASRSDLDGDDEFLQLAMALAFLASMACLFVSALWLTRRFTREHRRIAATLHRIAHGDVYARAPMGNTDPDLEQWAHDLNGLAEQLGVLIQIATAIHRQRRARAALPVGCAVRRAAAVLAPRTQRRRIQGLYFPGAARHASAQTARR
ncbi:MAG: hypothetical protein QM756_42920 [Polyangiaceae bacterium]